MATATLSPTGRLTVPKAIRKHLQLRPGDKLEFVIGRGQGVTLRSATIDIEELEGMFAHKVKRPVSVEEMNEAIRTRAGHWQ